MENTMLRRAIRISILLLVIGFVIIGLLKAFPQCLYKNRYRVENYTIYSNEYIDSSVVQIIDSVNFLVRNKLVDRQENTYNIYLNNSYFLFWFHTFLSKKPTGASNSVTSNIYIANTNLTQNYAYNFTNSTASKKRSIHSVIAHETMHIILRKKFGFWNYHQLLKKCNWKVEGLCEWIAFNNIHIDREEIQKILNSKSYIDNPYDRYKIYRAMVDFLLKNECNSLSDVMTSNDDFEDVLKKYAAQSTQPIGN